MEDDKSKLKECSIPLILVNSDDEKETKRESNSINKNEGESTSTNTEQIQFVKPSPSFLGNELSTRKHVEFKLSGLDYNDRGRPTIDWIRHQKTVAKRPPKQLITIDDETLKKHSTATDAWMCLRGAVYDVSTYINYHPGGIKQIMRGVGKNATELFNSIHSYVNFESILKEYLIGYYVSTKQSQLDLLNKLISPKPPVLQQDDHIENSLHPVESFSEDDEYYYYKVELNSENYDRSHWNVSWIHQNTLLLKIVIAPFQMWVINIKLPEKITKELLEVNFSKNYHTLIAKLQKSEGFVWTKGALNLPIGCLIQQPEKIPEEKINCTMEMRERIAQNFYLIGLKIQDSCSLLGVPVGYDIRVTALLKGMSRRFTPIPLIFESAVTNSCDINSDMLYLLVKVYPNGIFTPYLQNLELCTEKLLAVGSTSGDFDVQDLHETDHIVFLCGGSGITPFIGILDYITKRNDLVTKLKRVLLLHWSKEKEDVIWLNEFKKFEAENRWFEFWPIISGSFSDQEVSTGRVSKKHFQRIIYKSENDYKEKYFYMVCGPHGFNMSCLNVIENFQPSNRKIYVFKG